MQYIVVYFYLYLAKNGLNFLMKTKTENAVINVLSHEN